jgi:omega-hydroxy-beta-dihydromenaquinone-9 sulfotransferase
MSAAPPSRKPEWAPRIWEGSDFFAWLRLLARNRFAVHPAHWYIASIITFVSFGHTLLRLLQGAIYGRAIRETKLTAPPIFILGHWRTGTTLLHELLVQDERFGYPTTYACLDPCDFLLTERLFSRLLWFLVPSRRPMDNMKAGFDRPQEDEFALCLLGAGSPYEMIAFPNRPPSGQEYLDLAKLSPRRLRRWKRSLKTFLRMVTFKNPKRLVLKSPPHTARIAVLRQMFPGALFLHIVRDPHVVFASTVNLWRTLFQTHGLQKPTGAGLEEYVLETYLRMHARLEEGKKLLEPRQFFELRYEDLILNPAGVMQQVYDHFSLDGFAQYLPRLEAYLATIKGYETNRYQLTPEQRALVTQRWGPIIRQYGFGGASVVDGETVMR